MIHPELVTGAETNFSAFEKELQRPEASQPFILPLVSGPQVWLRGLKILTLSTISSRAAGAFPAESGKPASPIVAVWSQTVSGVGTAFALSSAKDNKLWGSVGELHEPALALIPNLQDDTSPMKAAQRRSRLAQGGPLHSEANSSDLVRPTSTRATHRP